MLVLSRKRNERIVIQAGGRVLATVNVNDICGDKVRLGISADPAVAIHRQEVFDRIVKEQGHG